MSFSKIIKLFNLFHRQLLVAANITSSSDRVYFSLLSLAMFISGGNNFATRKLVSEIRTGFPVPFSWMSVMDNNLCCI